MNPLRVLALWLSLGAALLASAEDDAAVFGPRSRDFVVNRKYLVFPINGREWKAQLRLTVEGQEVQRYIAKLATSPEKAHTWLYLDIDAYRGKKATVSVGRVTEEGFALIQQADKVPGQEKWYTEPMRPQFHFSQAVGWNNDVNGTVYYDGEWHLFFQHNPAGLKWDNMTWGHAVSKDLVHWQQLPSALYPYTMAKGMCWSGGANVDKQNTAGLKRGKEAPIVAFVTDSGAGGECLAYSNDRGRTFTWYEGNPVLKHNGRDPKVIWYAYDQRDTPLDETAKRLGGHWVMAVYDEAPEHGRNIAFYTSTDLKQWQEQSHLKGYYECSELFELPVDGDPRNTRWVVFAGDARYAVGQFDGKTFTPEHEERHTLYHGPFYGSQLFSNSPDGRQIQIGWLNIDIHGHPFNQVFSFPYCLRLHTTSDGIRMFAEPVKEIETLRKNSQTLANQPLDDDESAEVETAGELFDIRAIFEVGSAKKIGLEIGKQSVVYDVETNHLGNAMVNIREDGREKGVATMKPVDGKVTLQVLVDRPMLEIIGNRGEVCVIKPKPHAKDHRVSSIRAFATGGEAELIKLEVHELNSIWPNSSAPR